MSLWPLLQLLAGLHLLICLGFYSYGFLATLARHFRGARGGRPSLKELSVSMLKPLHGLDPALESNLESFAKLDVVPHFEVLLLVDDTEDPAYPVARRVAQRYPERVRVIVGKAKGCSNPKIGSLAHALPHARYDLIWLTDSNVETSNTHLRAHLKTWAEAQSQGRQPTLVHAPLAAVRGTGVGARCERLQLVSYNNVSREVALLGGVDVVVGKSILVHREDLRGVGGFEAFANASGEDFMMGRAFRQAGVVRCTSEATRQVLGEDVGWHDFFERQRRWATLRRQMVRGSFYGLEHFTYFGVPLALAALGLLPLSWVAAAYAFKMLADGILMGTYLREVPNGVDLLFLPVKELLLLGAWVSAMFSRQVTWRGRSLRVEASAYSTQEPSSAGVP